MVVSKQKTVGSKYHWLLLGMTYHISMFFVPKKDGQFRMVIDYRHLNSQTVNDVYPLPLIPQLLDDMKDAVYFTKLDLVGAYQLLRVAVGFERS